MANEGNINAEIRFDKDYLYTIHGKICVVLIVLGFINMIMLSTTWGGGLLWAAITFGFIESITKLVFYLLHIPEKFYTIPWLPFEIAAACVITILYFAGSLIVIMISTALHTTIGIFGLITTAVYGYSGYLKYQSWKNGELAQGSLSSSSSTNYPGSTPSAFPA